MKKKTVALLMAVTLACTAAAGTVKTASVQAEEFKETGKIWVLGDSIASDHNDEDNLRDNSVPITGWGNVLQNYVSGEVTIENKARSGRSSKSYTREQVYKEVKKGVQAGDYVIIQFGHNDEKADNNGLYTDPSGDSATEGSFKNYLKTYYIDLFTQKGARVILASSVVRHDFENDKLAAQSHEAYATAMKELAEECQAAGQEVYFIDTYQITSDLYNELGEEASAKMHAVLGQEPETSLDTTHYGPYGAMRIAGILAQELKELGIECCQNVKNNRLANKEAADAKRSEAEKFSWR